MEAVPNLHAAVVDYAYSNVATAVLYEHRSTNSASDTDPSYPSSASATADVTAVPSRFEWRFLSSMVEGADFRLARQWMYAPTPLSFLSLLRGCNPT